MPLKERVYSVLLVSASASLRTAMEELLPAAGCRPLCTVGSISAARQALTERSFDFVIVNAPLPDDFGLRFAIDCSSAKGTVVLLLVRGEIHAEIHDRVVEHGVFTMAKPLSRQSIQTALGWMASARERLRRFEQKSLSLEEKMEEIRLVNRAKWLLISELKMSEPEAHRYVEKQAMDRCVPKREIAAEILKLYG